MYFLDFIFNFSKSLCVFLQHYAWLESCDQDISFDTKILGSLIVSPVLWVLSSRNTLSVTHSDTASYTPPRAFSTIPVGHNQTPLNTNLWNGFGRYSVYRCPPIYIHPHMDIATTRPNWPDTWHRTPDMWQMMGGEHPLILVGNGGGLKIWRKMVTHSLINQSISNRGVSRTQRAGV